MVPNPKGGAADDAGYSRSPPGSSHDWAVQIPIDWTSKHGYDRKFVQSNQISCSQDTRSSPVQAGATSCHYIAISLCKNKIKFYINFKNILKILTFLFCLQERKENFKMMLGSIEI